LRWTQKRVVERRDLFTIIARRMRKGKKKNGRIIVHPIDMDRPIAYSKKGVKSPPQKKKKDEKEM